MDNLDDLELLSKEDLIEMLRERAEAGVKLTFPGKAMARRLSRKVRPHIQRPIEKLSFGNAAQRSKNLLIEGDNLQAMVTLYRERGHVDLIVTDPPYNTGNDFRYNDKWDEDPNDPGIGDLVAADDRARHTKWMKFMYPRLQLMRQMLRESGVLAICIDHRELFHLGQMLDEIFGEANRLAVINWQKITSPKNQDKGVSTSTEYVLVYARNEQVVKTGRLTRSEKTAAGYVNPDSDPRGAWAPSDSTLMGAKTHPGQVYGIQNPFSGKLHYPQEGRCWRNERSKMKAAAEKWGVEYEDRQLDDGMRPALLIKGARNPLTEDFDADPAVVSARVAALAIRERDEWPRFFWRNDQAGRTGYGEIRAKTYLEDVARGVVPTTFWATNDDIAELELGVVSWTHSESGTSEVGVRELNAVVGRGHGFDTVKPLKLIQKIIQLWSPPGGTVVDPFAGSGTTGHAVLALNESEGADRRFILIEQGRPERGDSYARTLTADRLARVISGKWANGKGSPIDSGYEFRQLTKNIDAPALLQMEREEMVDIVVSSYFDSSRRRGPNLERVGEPSNRYLVAKNAENEGFYLVWGGAENNIDFDEDVYEGCVQEGTRAGLKPKYHVYGRYNLFSTPGVHFYQIPDRILADFGLDVRTESYTEADE